MVSVKIDEKRGIRFKEARKRAGYTQEDVIQALAKRDITISQTRLSRLEGGYVLLNETIVTHALADLYNADINYLMFGEGPLPKINWTASGSVGIPEGLKDLEQRTDLRDGIEMSDDEFRSFCELAWFTIYGDMVNKITSDQWVKLYLCMKEIYLKNKTE